MSRQLTHEEIRARVELVDAPHLVPAKPADVDRTFGLPVGLHAAYFGLFLGYLALMGFGFASPGLILPMAIFVLFTVAAYAVPAAWTRLSLPGAAPKAERALSLEQLFGKGIAVETGHNKGSDAAIQVLILPVLIFGWGIAVVSIAALVD